MTSADELEQKMRRLIDSGKTETQRNLNYLMMLSMVECMKGEKTKLDVFRSRQGMTEVYTVIIPEDY